MLPSATGQQEVAMAFLETNAFTRRFGVLTVVDSLTIALEAGEAFGLLVPAEDHVLHHTLPRAATGDLSRIAPAGDSLLERVADTRAVGRSCDREATETQKAAALSARRVRSDEPHRFAFRCEADSRTLRKSWTCHRIGKEHTDCDHECQSNEKETVRNALHPVHPPPPPRAQRPIGKQTGKEEH